MAGAAKLAVAEDAAILGDREGPLAQLGERRLDKAEVAGSSPARPIEARAQPFAGGVEEGV
jgi:hypothetical protein